MPGTATLSVRDPKPARGKLRQWNVRLPQDVFDYLERAAPEDSARTKSGVVIDAVRLDAHLDSVLTPHREKLRAYALEHGLNLDDKLPQVYAALILLGLKSRSR